MQNKPNSNIGKTDLSSYIAISYVDFGRIWANWRQKNKANFAKYFTKKCMNSILEVSISMNTEL